MGTKRDEWRVAAKAATIVMVVVGGVWLGSGAVWDTGVTSSFEETPQDTAFVSGGATQIRATRNEVRRRADVEHDWSTVNAGDVDSGRHRKGSARVFYQTTAPTVMPYADTSGTPSTALDDGRLWWDSDGGALSVYTGSAWTSATVPQYGIILWDQTNGDANCDGTPGAGECPCGYTEATAFRSLAIRGADVAAGTTTIPDAPGVTCDNSYGGGIGTGCSSPVGQSYDDSQSSTTLVAHTHGTGVSSSGGGSAVHANGSGSGLTMSTGDGHPWPGPFRTVLFCRKS